MRILYVAMKYDYGRPSQGLSFEHYNFYHSLLHMGHDIVYFDFMTLLQEHGRAWMNRRLLEVAKAEQADVMFTVLFSDEFDHATIRRLTEDVGIPTLNWFCDDHWRFENYSRQWAPCFRWVVTTSDGALPKYEKMGYHNVIKSQWACNTFLYRPMSVPLAYDVTFVGQPYGDRKAIIDQIRKAGIDVRVWGTGWESGRVSQEEMIRIFSQSRINLNLTTAYGQCDRGMAGGPRVSNNLLANILSHASFFKGMWFNGSVRSRMDNPSDAAQAPTDSGEPTVVVHPEQIKGRNFEVPGCGGFLLTGNADNLAEYYAIGKEVVTFEDADDMITQIRYYLKHEDERRAIAYAGYERTLREHTYPHRIAEIFQRLGFKTTDCAAVLDHTRQRGHREEVR